jgi:alpha-tubulin suppressor-like RCC1 family protein
MPGQRRLLTRNGLVRSGSLATLLALVLLCILATGVSASPGQVFAFGSNYYGQLGSATNNGKSTPNPNPALLSLPGATGSVVQLAAGEQHSLALTSAGQLYAFGYNSYGQLGSTTNNGTSNPNPNPAPLSLPGASGSIVQVAAGRNYSLALTSTGQLYAFGQNYYAQLGNSTNNKTSTANPTPTIVSLPGATGPVVQMAAGAYHSLALTSTGQLYAFGYNYYGELGNSTNTGVDTGNPTPTLVTLPGATGPIAGIAAGAYHSLVFTSTGQLYAFGYNYYGQLGNATNNVTSTANPTPTLVTLPGATGPVVQAAAGYNHSVVLTASGQVFTFGYNKFGQLGSTTNSGTETPNPAPTPVGLPGAVGPAVQVIAGEYNTYAVTSSGQLFTFGSNNYGQLGSATNSGTETANPTPALVAFPFGTTIDTVARGPESEHVLALVAELSVLSSTLPAGQVGVPYHATAASAGGTGAFNWRVSGLPAGLAIAPDGQISGTPTAAGASNVVLNVTDIFGLNATSATIPLTIAPAAVPITPIVISAKAPSVAQLKASLLVQLGITGKAAKIGALLKSKSYSLSFKALSAGTLAISWYFLPPGAHIAKKKKAKPVLFASGKLTFNAPATKKITIKLTGKGQGLIKHRSSIKLTATGSFKPVGKAAITAKKPLTLKR